MIERLNISKKIDSLGRIVIPQSLRARFAISPGDELEIALVDGWIGLRKKGLTSDAEKAKIAIDLLHDLGILVPNELLQKFKVKKE